MNDSSEAADNKDLSTSAALRFVVLLGVVSLLADATYEGARSISGPFLALLGASGATVGLVAGFGELIGYGLRLASGYVTERTGKHWGITIFGYAVNLLAVPALALSGRWEFAAMLLVLERVGKAIRTPARDVMLSHATSRMGRGWGFGLHEAMDQIGAVLGPVIVAAILFAKKGYQTAFAWLLVPALLALSVLAVARFLYPRPRDFEFNIPVLKGEGFPRSYWMYLIAVCLVAAGYADFPLIAFHLKKISAASDSLIPVLYAIAMGVDAVAALVFGRMFDRKGLPVLASAFLISAFFAPFAFGRSLGLAIAGMVLWGIGMGAQESVMRAAIANMVPPEKRGSAYGIFNATFGIVWFLGSALMGLLYDVSLPALILFSVIAQLCAIPILLRLRKTD